MRLSCRFQIGSQHSEGPTARVVHRAKRRGVCRAAEQPLGGSLRESGLGEVHGVAETPLVISWLMERLRLRTLALEPPSRIDSGSRWEPGSRKSAPAFRRSGSPMG